MNTLELRTERLSLRLIRPSDLQLIHELHSLPETDRFNALGIPKNIAETKAIITGWIAENQQQEISNYTFAIELREKQQFVGLAGFKLGNKKYQRAEVWYKIHSDYWGKGIATEVLGMTLDFGFDTLQLHRIEAGCAVDNAASIRVLEKAGMKQEGRRRKVLPLKTGWSDNVEYAMLDTDERASLKTEVLV